MGRENSQFLFFDDSEDAVRRVYSKGLADKRELRDTPPFDRLDRWEVPELSANLHRAAESQR